MSNTISAAELLFAATSAGIEPLEQTSFYKIASQRKAVYVSKTKRRVTRVDIAGFAVDHPAVHPPVKKNGKVTGQVDMDHPQALEAIGLAFQVLTNGKVEGDKFVKGSR